MEAKLPSRLALIPTTNAIDPSTLLFLNDLDLVLRSTPSGQIAGPDGGLGLFYIYLLLSFVLAFFLFLSSFFLVSTLFGDLHIQHLGQDTVARALVIIPGMSLLVEIETCLK